MTTEDKPAIWWWPHRWNSHNPKEFQEKLETVDQKEFRKLAEEFIWLSAYANNNPRSDYHWMCDATYEVGERRFPGLYAAAHKAVSKGA